MTTKQREELALLEAKEQLTDREFDRYEYLKKQAANDEIIKQFKKNQAAPYPEKISRAGNLAWEFMNKLSNQCFVSVGGLDSIVLYLFLRKEGINVPAVSVSSLEDKSIQMVHRALGVQALKPLRSKVEVIREFGWPVISKEIAGKIDLLQHPTEDNATVRHAIITGETGAQGGWSTESRMQLAQKWLRLFGGWTNEIEGTDYGHPDFFVSDKCCYYLKEKPCDDYAKETGRFPFMGLMASEGGRREKALMINGYNYYGVSTIRSAPFATFLRDDLLHLAMDMNTWYLHHWEMFPGIDGHPLDSIVPSIYGEIYFDKYGIRQTSKAQRTGCSMCGFGIQKEKRPHRFDLLYERNPKEWTMWMTHVDQDADGNWYGWGKVLDYIGVAWRYPEWYLGKSLTPPPPMPGMISLGELLEMTGEAAHKEPKEGDGENG